MFPIKIVIPAPRGCVEDFTNLAGWKGGEGVTLTLIDRGSVVNVTASDITTHYSHGVTLLVKREESLG